MPRRLSRMSAVLLLAASVTSAMSLYAADKIIDRSGPHSELVVPGPDGALQYVPDERGDIIVDFSHCGYKGGGVPIPDVPAVMTLEPSGANDETTRIQSAIEEISARELGADGFRGALLLKRGTWRLGGQLRISASGVVLRGEGPGMDGTVLVGFGGPDAGELITVIGEGTAEPDEDTSQAVTDSRAPVGTHTLTLADASNFSVGDAILVRQKTGMEWAHEIRMDRILVRPSGKKPTRQWKGAKIDYERIITAIDGNTITLNAPLAWAIDKRWGTADVVRYTFPGRISHVGVEHLRLTCEYDASVTDYHDKDGLDLTYESDEEHRTGAASLNILENGWLRNLTCSNFRYGIRMGNSKWCTAQDCVMLNYISKIEGGRRAGISGGVMTLKLRCYVETSRHAYSFGSRVPGPNAVVDCVAHREFAGSDAHQRWSTASLYDNCYGNYTVMDRQFMGSGQGWGGANYVAWNTRGVVAVQSPETARNLAIGHVGRQDPGTFARAALKWQEENPGKELPVHLRQQQGHWESKGTHVGPRSLYLAQLEDRLGADAVRAIATPEQISGHPLASILAYAREQGAVYTAEEWLAK